MLHINRIKIITVSIILGFFIQNNGNAASIDNILKVCFYSKSDSSYLILHESFFHPTSGSYDKGNLRAQGYTTSRISVYSLINGNLIAQKNMGVMDSAEACYVLGCSADNLWVYSNQHKSGLQSLLPLSLEKNISQATIYKSLNTSIGRFINPTWNEITNYFGFDAIQQKLIVTNTRFEQFYIDAETFATQPIKEKIKLNPPTGSYTSESAEFKDSIWNLTGYEQMNLKCGKLMVSKPSFLYGKFLLEQNKVRLFKHFLDVYESSTEQQISALKNKDSIKVTNAANKIKLAKSNIESVIYGTKPDDVLLQTDKNSLFVISKSDKTAEAYITISKLHSERFGQFYVAWSVTPTGMFYNIAQARDTKIFKQFFGDMPPDFNYQFMQIHDNKLVIIYLLQVCCIDTNTGKILFQFKLR